MTTLHKASASAKESGAALVTVALACVFLGGLAMFLQSATMPVVIQTSDYERSVRTDAMADSAANIIEGELSDEIAAYLSANPGKTVDELKAQAKSFLNGYEGFNGKTGITMVRFAKPFASSETEAGTWSGSVAKEPTPAANLKITSKTDTANNTVKVLQAKLSFKISLPDSTGTIARTREIEVKL